MGWRGITPEQVERMPWFYRTKARRLAAEWEKYMRDGK